jgi:hypothetical protein
LGVFIRHPLEAGCFSSFFFHVSFWIILPWTHFEIEIIYCVSALEARIALGHPLLFFFFGKNWQSSKAF